MSNNSKKPAFLTVRLPEDLFDQVKKTAAKERRSVSNWVRVVLEQNVNKKL